jgi:hypothetical protein
MALITSRPDAIFAASMMMPMEMFQRARAARGVTV